MPAPSRELHAGWLPPQAVWGLVGRGTDFSVPSGYTSARSITLTPLGVTSIRTMETQAAPPSALSAIWQNHSPVVSSSLSSLPGAQAPITSFILRNLAARPFGGIRRIKLSTFSPIFSPPLAFVSPRLFRNSQGGDALPNPLRGRRLVWLFLTTSVYDCPVLLLSTPLSGRSGWSTQPRGNPKPDFLEFPYLFSRDLYNFRHKPHSLKYSPSCFDFA